MAMLLSLAFAAIIFGQFAAVVVVHSERKRRESEAAALPHLDHRQCSSGTQNRLPPGHWGLLRNAAWSAR